ncbi:carboxymuconolactone decarboxylase family protein [Rhizobium cauense]|uniref:carboxymuconolactone decarboxylase family protein n=1 Tax=Rhizobium cauense TaxID=1166683 RepID=UPI0030B8ACA9
MAAANGCDYCLAAHTGGAPAAGVSAEDRASAQMGRTSDPKIQAILELALAINATHGQGAAAALEAARA